MLLWTLFNENPISRILKQKLNRFVTEKKNPKTQRNRMNHRRNHRDQVHQYLI